jgi:hypothetical protein
MTKQLPDPDKAELYRFPWSLNDNPQGWVEITDICNLHCRGCYRQRLEGHKSLDKIKEEIVFLKRWRNCDNISLAGGEPVLHPDIVEIVRFIAAQGMKPFMLGNGVALTREICIDLKKAGLVGLGLHIDMGQDRPGWTGKNEIELCALREQLANMVYDVGGISCNFNITVYKENFSAVPHLVTWAIRNSKKVQGFTFMTYRAAIVEPGRNYVVDGRRIQLSEGTLGYATNAETQKDISLMSTDVYRIIRENVPEYMPSAYLGGTKDHTSFKWLDGLVLCSGGKPVGSIGKKTMELAQTMHHVLYGTYLIYLRKKSAGKKIFFLSLADRQVRDALVKFLSNPLNLLRPLRTVGIAIVQAPDALTHGDIDMCESCPDITFFNGRLVNSCRLDEYRKFGGSMSLAGAVSAPQHETRMRPQNAVVA